MIKIASILFIAIILLSNSNLFSQKMDQDSLNHNKMIVNAKELARQNKWTEAKLICISELQKKYYPDFALLLGRLYSWEKHYDSARVVFNKLFEEQFQDYDVINSMIDVELWSGKYEEALKKCNIGLSFFEQNENFLFKKAKGLSFLEEYNDSKNILENILAKNPNNNDAVILLESIKKKTLKNKITVNYTLDYFENNNPSAWHLLYLQYSRRIRNNNLIARVNAASRFNKAGIQYEVDMYPKFSKNFYGYLNLGYSEAVIFPKFRTGEELYFKLPKAFEGSIGIRYLKFQSSDVLIYTCYLGKYFGNYWASVRPFISKKQTGLSSSWTVMIRRYFSTSQNYIGLKYTYGNSPDDRNNLLINTDVFKLNSNSIKLEFNHELGKYWIFGSGITFENEEYFTAKKRNVLTFEIGLSRIF